MLLQIWENLSIKIDLFVCINLYMCYTIKKGGDPKVKYIFLEITNCKF